MNYDFLNFHMKYCLMIKGLFLDECEWLNTIDMTLPRPRKGHCMVTVGDNIVLVGGGPDNYGSTQVRN